VVAAIAPVLRDVLGQRVTLAPTLARDLPPVEVDRGQVETLLVNMAANARDAMAGGGTLTVATAAVDLDAAAARPLELQPGRHVALTVRDTGAGMAPEVLARIFEPFFTTKEVGAGTGLGLASVHGVVKQLGGAVTAESAPGQGATFRVFLPAGQRAAARPYDGSSPPSDSSAAATRSQVP
jgi:signal transduction histidine kinase